jgi:cell division septum initiation protein DivIVA
MAQAQEEANRTLALARDKADQLTQKDMIVQDAQRRADQIIAQARADAEATRLDADNYVIETLMQLQDQLARLSNQVNNGVRALQEDHLRKATGSPGSSVSASVPEKLEK